MFSRYGLLIQTCLVSITAPGLAFLCVSHTLAGDGPFPSPPPPPRQRPLPVVPELLDEHSAPKTASLPMHLLLRQLILDRYDSTESGTLNEQDKQRLLQDARSARRVARQRFLQQFDTDGDGKLNPQEHRELQKHLHQRRHNKPPHRNAQNQLPPSDSPPPPRVEHRESGSPHDGRHKVNVRTPGSKQFRVDPGVFLLMRNLLLQRYDTDKDGKLSPMEHAAIRQAALKLYQNAMAELIELYDLDQDGKLSPVEREQALAADALQNSLPESPDEVDLFIRANMASLLLQSEDEEEAPDAPEPPPESAETQQ